MTPGLIALLLLVTLLLGIATVVVFQRDAAFRGAVIVSADPAAGARSQLVARLDERFLRTRLGTRLAALLAGAGLPGWSPIAVLAGAMVAALLTAFLTLPLLGRAGAVIAALAVVFLGRQWLEKRRRARVDRFVAQLPELARLLSNSAEAGLSMQRGLALAAKEMSEPAATEVQQVVSELAVGRRLQASLESLSERLPSRELAVLVQILVIQSRAGGALVTALSGIATTLEERRQLRREVRTATAGASATGLLVIGLGVGAVILMNIMNPGVLDDMLGTFVGQLVIAVSVSLFLVGYLLMRRLGKVDL